MSILVIPSQNQKILTGFAPVMLIIIFILFLVRQIPTLSTRGKMVKLTAPSILPLIVTLLAISLLIASFLT